jgi:signal transduction histidine kinase
MSLQLLRQELPVTAGDLHAALIDASAAVTRIARIVNNMLDLVRLEASRLVIHRAPTRLADILKSVVECRAGFARQHGVRLMVEADDRLQVDADADLLTRVVENLVDNSLQHVPDGGRVLLRTESPPGAATILIGNDGPPVPAVFRLDLPLRPPRRRWNQPQA